MMPPSPAQGPAAITSEQLREWIERRQRSRARVKAIVAIVLAAGIGLLAIVWTFFHQQFSVRGNLEALGYAVDWDINPANFSRGGTTAVTYRPRYYSLSNAPRPRPEGLELIKSLLHVTTLDLSTMTNLTEDDVAVVADLPELTELQLNRNPTWRGQVVRPLDDRLIGHIKGLTRLKTLGLSQDRITDAGVAGLANLTDLESLDLEGTLVTDNGLDALKGLKRLKFLRLENTAVTREGIAELQRALPNTEITFEQMTVESIPQ